MPGARLGAKGVTDSAGNLWLFGGRGNDASDAAGDLGDLWKFQTINGTWGWVAGSSTVNAAGIYGTQGTAAPGNAPGARSGASSWIDARDNIWVFAGHGEDSAGASGDLNDLWKFNPANNTWTWISGTDVVNATGTYGTVGTAAASNMPGARQDANSWIDAAGNFWVFGGQGYDSAGNSGQLSDLWKYTASTGTWTWVSGSKLVNATTVYGTLGAVSPSAAPGGRSLGYTWLDPAGSLWLFGGYGYDASRLGYLNDMWVYTP
jgi:N-acetylneuraminic acid mutarotase